MSNNVSELFSSASLTDRYQIVVIDCAYGSIQEKMTQEFFAKFVAAKLHGYMKEYPYGVLPFNTYDIVGAILMLCEKKADGELEPIMVFKSTSAERCKKFNLPFELFEYFQKPGTEEYKKVCEGIIENAQSRGVNVGYNSSWTIHKRIRETPELGKMIRDISVMMVTNYYTQYQIQEVLIAGVVKFKVDKLQAFVGFEHLKGSDGEMLPPIACPFLFGEQTAIMHLKAFSPEAKAIANQYADLWNSRWTLNETAAAEKKKAA